MENYIKEKKRCSWLDIAKGVGIIFIVIGHVLRDGIIRTYIYSFHVPLFFMLMGFTFKCENIKSFSRKKFFRNLVPYYFWSILSIIIYLIMITLFSLDSDGGSTSFLMNFLGMIYANSRNGLMRWNLPLWFIPCMIGVSYCVLLLEKCIFFNGKYNLMPKNRLYVRIFLIVLFAIIGSSLPYVCNVYLPFQFESGIYMISFFESGILLKEIEFEKIVRNLKSVKLILFCLFSLTCAFILININGFAEVREYNYGNYFGLFFLTSMLICIVILIITIMWNKCKLIENIGMHTFSILLTHKFPILFFQKIMLGTKYLLSNPNTFAGVFCAVIVTTITIIMCLVITHIISKTCPVLIGEFKK